MRRGLHINDEACVQLNKSYESLVCDIGGHNNIPFIEQDVQNFMAKEILLLGQVGDEKALSAYFMRMREYNRDFF